GGRTGRGAEREGVPIPGSGESRHCGHETLFVDHTGGIIPFGKVSVKSALFEVRYEKPLAASLVEQNRKRRKGHGAPCTLILRGFTRSNFGSRSVRTPFLSAAPIRSGSTSSVMRKAR